MDTIPTDVLEKALSEFKNSRDEDIERFLQKKAMLYETRKWCSTYVLVSEEALKANKTIKVEGYFTLSNKVLQISDEVSKNRKKKLFNGVKKDDYITGGTIIAEVPESSSIVHKSMVPPNIEGKVIDVKPDRDNHDKTIVVFERDEAFEKAFAELNEELKAKETAESK